MLLFPGFVIGILVVAYGLPAATCVPVCQERRLKWLFGLVYLVSFLFSLRPFLVLLGKNTGIPVPLLLFHHLVPGFQAIRVPAQFVLMAVLAAGVLAGFGSLKAGSWMRAHWPIEAVSTRMLDSFFALFWIGIFLCELGFKPLPLVSVPTGDRVPEVYRWLATRQLNGPILEMPVGRGSPQALPYQYMYFSTYHWLPLVNGMSGYTPLLSDYIASQTTELPSPRVTELLSALGVQGVVLHTDHLESHEALRWRQADLTGAGMQEIARFGSDVVYRLSRPEAAPRPHLALAIPDPPSSAQVMRLPTGAMMRFGLLAANDGPGLWAHPSPLGRARATIHWAEVQTGKALIQREYLELPLAISAGASWPTGIPVRTPGSPGRYWLSIGLPTLGLEADPKLLDVVSNSSQTSVDAPHALSAVYVLEKPSSETITAKVTEVVLQVTNTGESIWLADTTDDREEVRLEWRWYRETDSLPFEEGREYLPYDIFPGQSYQFKATIKAPQEPGYMS